MQKLYFNQNHISFESIERSKEHPYGIYNKQALFTASDILSKNALKLYIYLGSFQELKDGLYLSKKDALAKTHMTEKAYFNAKKELKEKGYLIKNQNSQDQDSYTFIEGGTPQKGE